eukprot:m.102287 g.102287  ORF g.102287 m.102287 type:complete len:1309 (-) comp10432_c0_seq1:81-4007(-)
MRRLGGYRSARRAPTLCAVWSGPTGVLLTVISATWIAWSGVAAQTSTQTRLAADIELTPSGCCRAPATDCTRNNCPLLAGTVNVDYVQHTGVSDRLACRNLCAANTSCVAYELNNAPSGSTCDLWNRLPTGTNGGSGGGNSASSRCQCYTYLPRLSLAEQCAAVPCGSRCSGPCAWNSSDVCVPATDNGGQVTTADELSEGTCQLVSNGTLCNASFPFITSEAVCNVTAHALGLTDSVCLVSNTGMCNGAAYGSLGGGTDLTDAEVEALPYGCWWKEINTPGRRLWFNPRGNTTVVDPDRVSICGYILNATASPTTAPPSTAPSPAPTTPNPTAVPTTAVPTMSPTTYPTATPDTCSLLTINTQAGDRICGDTCGATYCVCAALFDAIPAGDSCNDMCARGGLQCVGRHGDSSRETSADQGCLYYNQGSNAESCDATGDDDDVCVCGRPVTARPTSSPVAQPTAVPTTSPSQRPTTRPTLQPSQQRPTNAPVSTAPVILLTTRRPSVTVGSPTSRPTGTTAVPSSQRLTAAPIALGSPTPTPTATGAPVTLHQPSPSPTVTAAPIPRGSPTPSPSTTATATPVPPGASTTDSPTATPTVTVGRDSSDDSSGAMDIIFAVVAVCIVILLILLLLAARRRQQKKEEEDKIITMSPRGSFFNPALDTSGVDGDAAAAAASADGVDANMFVAAAAARPSSNHGNNKIDAHDNKGIGPTSSHERFRVGHDYAAKDVAGNGPSGSGRGRGRGRGGAPPAASEYATRPPTAIAAASARQQHDYRTRNARGGVVADETYEEPTDDALSGRRPELYSVPAEAHGGTYIEPSREMFNRGQQRAGKVVPLAKPQRRQHPNNTPPPPLPPAPVPPPAVADSDAPEYCEPVPLAVQQAHARKNAKAKAALAGGGGGGGGGVGGGGAPVLYSTPDPAGHGAHLDDTPPAYEANPPPAFIGGTMRPPKFLPSTYVPQSGAKTDGGGGGAGGAGGVVGGGTDRVASGSGRPLETPLGLPSSNNSTLYTSVEYNTFIDDAKSAEDDDEDSRRYDSFGPDYAVTPLVRDRDATGPRPAIRGPRRGNTKTTAPTKTGSVAFGSTQSKAKNKAAKNKPLSTTSAARNKVAATTSSSGSGATSTPKGGAKKTKGSNDRATYMEPQDSLASPRRPSTGDLLYAEARDVDGSVPPVPGTPNTNGGGALYAEPTTAPYSMVNKKKDKRNKKNKTPTPSQPSQQHYASVAPGTTKKAGTVQVPKGEPVYYSVLPSDFGKSDDGGASGAGGYEYGFAAFGLDADGDDEPNATDIAMESNPDYDGLPGTGDDDGC